MELAPGFGLFQEINNSKQFILTSKNQTFLNSTIERFKSDNFNNITVVGNFEHRFLIYDSIVKTKIKPEAVLLEPESKKYPSCYNVKCFTYS